MAAVLYIRGTVKSRRVLEHGAHVLLCGCEGGTWVRSFM
jgi:hypothetical protein